LKAVPSHWETAVSTGALVAILLLFNSGRTEAAPTPYSEPYRPQFHFSPASGWVGDPDGLIRYHGKYHLFWWGHAESSDLVFWNERPYPMTGGDGSFTYYTGSVVVDRANTSGFGSLSQPAMVAVYTAHRKSDGLENQRLSFSTNYTAFHYFAGNPVLDIGSTSFRDPDVCWDTQSQRWIMAIALPDDRKVNFYASSNLQSWQYISQFGPVAARDQVWEVPNLFQLPLNGDTNLLKWVLVCSMGPNRVQYFVGNFNGTNFTLDPACRSYLLEGAGVEGTVFADFEDAGYGAWAVQGSAFGSGPARGTLPGQNVVSGHLGSRLASSFSGGDDATGKLISSPFIITNNCINFLIGGGNHPGQTCINLRVNGTPVRTATGQNSEILKWAGWNVAQWKGKPARLEIVDNATGPWGHIGVDHILFGDVLMNFNYEHALWVDWGPDFYAVRAYRDYDTSAPCRYWLGWMGNWEYARDVPTSWGRGAQSVPRQLALVTSRHGYDLIQEPLPGLQALRSARVDAASRRFQGTVPLIEFQPRKNTYELEAVFPLDTPDQNFGLNLCVAASTKVVVGYDAANSNLYLDRRTSGNVGFNANFPKLVIAPFSTSAGFIKFHVFVDQSSIEIFVNDGRAVMTSLFFPDSSSRGLELFSSNGPSTLRQLVAWELRSIWDVPAASR
jgi:fructan beta-fructosidase